MNVDIRPSTLRKKDFKSTATNQSTNCKEFFNALLLSCLLKERKKDFKSKATSQSTDCKEFVEA